MEVQFTPEQEAQILQIARHNGTPADQLVKDTVLRMIAADAEFRAGVRRGIEQADRGQLLDHDAVKARIERTLKSR